MRLLFLLLALLAACPGARAQLVPAATPTVLNPAADPAPVLAAPDTAAALHRIFVHKRRRSYLGLGVGAGALLTGLALVNTNGGTQSLRNNPGGLLGIVAGVPVLATSVVHMVRYSKAGEQRTLLAWQQHRLPHYLKRALAADTLLAARLPAPVRLAPAVTAEALDTAVALRQYFVERRRKNRVGLLVGGGILAGGAILLGTANGYKDLGNAALGVLSIGVSVPLLLIDLGHTLAYSKAQERRTLQAWEQHHVLPRWSRRALSPEYTHH